MLLTKMLVTLAKAPLTRNFDHRELQSILDSGGFRNWWQKNQALPPVPEPDAGASKRTRRSTPTSRSGSRASIGSSASLPT
jgi:hypothetical protein